MLPTECLNILNENALLDCQKPREETVFNFKTITAVAAVLATAAFAPAVATAQIFKGETAGVGDPVHTCLLYTSPSPRDRTRSRMPSSA